MKSDEGQNSGPPLVSASRSSKVDHLRFARRLTAYIPERHVCVYTTPFCGQRSVGRATLAAGATSREHPGQHLPSLLRPGNEHASRSEEQRGGINK